MNKALILLCLFCMDIKAQDIGKLLIEKFTVTLSGGQIIDPIFRSLEEVSIETSRACINFRAGFEVIEKRIGGGIDLSFWPAVKFDDTDEYSSMKYSTFYFDFKVHLIPFSSENIRFGIYPFLALGSRSTTIQENVFNEYIQETEFMYALGCGARLFVLDWLSIFAEYRFIPGDLTTPVSSGTGQPIGDSYTKNYTKISSFGIIVTPSKLLPSIMK